MTGQIEKTVFISYRRANVPWALAIYQNLTAHGYDVFFDSESIKSGDFEQTIIQNIKGRAHFVVILTPSALERCNEPGDWLRREIELAIEEKRNIVPLMLEGFTFSNPLISKYLTGKIAVLKNYNGLNVPADYFAEAMAKLRNHRLNVSLDAILHPISDTVQDAVAKQQYAASEAPPVEKEQLSAQEWYERGFVFVQNQNYDEAIQCYTKAIQLSPSLAEAFNERAIARQSKGDLNGAIRDYSEAILLKPNDAAAYLNRGVAFSAKGDEQSALHDFRRAIELEPNTGSFRPSLVRVLKILGRTKEAKEQEQIARRLIDRSDYYNWACLEAICGNTNDALRFLRMAKEAKQLIKGWALRDNNLENIRSDRRFKEIVGE